MNGRERVFAMISENFVPAEHKQAFDFLGTAHWPTKKAEPVMVMGKELTQVAQEIEIVETYNWDDEANVTHFRFTTIFTPNVRVTEDWDVIDLIDDLDTILEPHVDRKIRMEME